jgi:hypothetical protein
MTKTLSAAQRDNLSKRMQVRWQDIKQVAAWLQLDAFQLHRSWNAIPEAEREQLLHDMQHRQTESEGWRTRLSELLAERPRPPQLSVTRPDRQLTDTQTQIYATAEHLQLALWYIKKVGDIDQAETVFKAAIQVLRKTTVTE